MSGLCGKIYQTYRMNKILGWYLICRQYHVVKDIRQYVIKQGYLEEKEKYPYTKYALYLSPLQKYTMFHSTPHVDPSLRRELLRVPFKSFEEQYEWVKAMVVISAVPIVLLLIWRV